MTIKFSRDVTAKPKRKQLKRFRSSRRCLFFELQFHLLQLNAWGVQRGLLCRVSIKSLCEKNYESNWWDFWFHIYFAWLGGHQRFNRICVFHTASIWNKWCWMDLCENISNPCKIGI